MISFTPYELYIIVFGYLGWPLTLPLAILFGYLAYRAIPTGWKIGFLALCALFAFPLFAVWLIGLD